MKILPPDGTPFEDILNEWEEDLKKKNIRNWVNNKFPNGIYGYAAFYAITHPFFLVKGTGRRIKWAWQRVFRGWDDRSTWSISSYLSKLIAEMVAYMLEHKQGVPMTFVSKYPHDENYEVSEKDFAKAEEEWGQVLKEISEGFSLYDAIEERVVARQKFEKAFDLFKEHFDSLWW